MLSKITIILLFLLLLVSCQQSPQFVRKKPPIFYLTEHSKDSEYGKNEHKAIKTGGWKETGGHGGQRWFFSMLSGPNGEDITAEREGACCWHKNPTGYKGMVILDKYHVYIGDSAKAITLYLNSYEYQSPKIPVGFGTKIKYNISIQR
ncbi:hypothetical protein MS2017_1917 [Bathymodiolus thermophilus thioautotrophic gill symbiont]|uniref:Lipoprotein n=1 Tax=Bathymodiolus thermophilus thioautotrophic gill symbiont TaxID=2360 RepID=A0A3G3IP44_9GAMM|nr:hypothetical protein [Bathymodiolus thermophilus thioautotrophic gill symbiont]AYQ57581.1 hypothetical protein MS2017_1917 [Bathymodiolus thermophilus thioautotrophic gill symbiont]